MLGRILASVSAALLTIVAPSAAQTWTPGPLFSEAPQPRLHGAGLVYLGRIYVIGGSPFDTTSAHNGATDFYDGSAPTFIAGPPLDGPFISQGVGLDSLGRPVVFGGWTGPNGDYGGTFVFDPVEGGGGQPLASRSSQAPPADFAWTTDENGRIYSLGGGPGEAATAGSPNSTRVERYDAAANAWAVLAPLPGGLANAAAAADDHGHILVLGGINASATARVNSVFTYDIATDTWSSSATPPLPIALSNARAVQGPDQRIYVIGGATGAIGSAQPSASVWVLDQRTNTWSAGPTMSSARSDPAVVYDSDYESIFAMGGSDGAGGTYTSEELAVTTCPTFYSVAQSETLNVGRVAAFAAVAIGDTTITYQWRHNGTPILDGPTGTGSRVSGSGTNQVTITSLTGADAGSYDVIAANGCGSVTSPPAMLIVTPSPPLPAAPAWSVMEGSFGARTTSFNAVSGGVIAGGADYQRTVNPGAGSYFFKGLRWDGFAGDATAGFPIGTGIGSDISGMAGSLSVGYWQYIVSTVHGGHAIEKQGAVWSAVNGTITMSGLGLAVPLGTDGKEIVGTNGTSAFLWMQNATGAWGSYVLGAGFAAAAVNGSQYGQSYGHATRWSGAATTNLNPARASASELLGAWGEDQCGDFTTDVRHAGLWHGDPTVTDLSPAGSDSSWSTAMSGAYEAGNAFFGGVEHPIIWGSNPASYVDLGAVAGTVYTSAWANAMEADAVGNLMVVGGGVRASDGISVGLIWFTDPYAEIFRQPVSAQVSTTANATFTVRARGNGGLSYQWRHAGVPLVDNARIAGSQTATLQIMDTQLSDAGVYDVQVSNALRTEDSVPETLTVNYVAGVTSLAPALTRFAGVRPDPVRAAASVGFDLAHDANVRLRIYDVAGRLVWTLVDEFRTAGRYEIPWSPAGPNPPGLYFARFEADGVKETRRVVVVR